MSWVRLLLAALVLLAVPGCTGQSATSESSTAAAGVPAPVTVAAVDFPSRWLAQQVGGDAVELAAITAADVESTDAALFIYVPGLDPVVDQAASQLPAEQVVDVTGDVTRMASPRDPDISDPFVWFDPVNVATMGSTLAGALTEASEKPFVASQFYGVRALSLESEALRVDQRLQERLNPCRIATLVVEAPVLNYLARAYAFDQLPLISWKPSGSDVQALYFTLDAENAVREAASRNGLDPVPVDTFTVSAPEEDLLQGLVDLGDQIAAHQDCPLVTPSSSDRPG
jgi:zinc transport system substrate-binding protein